MKRVLQVINAMNSGGAEQLLLQQVVLARDVWDSSIACIDEVGSLGSLVRDANVPIESVGNGRRTNVMTIPRLRDLIRRQQPDVVHLHLPRAGVVGRLACRTLRGVPIVYTEHNVFEIYPRIPRALNTATYGRNDRVVAVSERVKRSILEHVPGRRLRASPTVIRNGVDTRSLNAAALSREDARRALGVAADAVVIGNVGNLFARKGQDVLIRAFAEIAGRHAGSRLVIIGRGDERNALLNLRDGLGLREQVLFAESIPDASRYLRAFDVFALSSIYEGLPVALLEAMALGLSCVATTVGGIPEVIRDTEDGLLVKPASPGDLASALDALMDSDERRRRLGEAARRRIVERFEMAEMIRSLDAVYDQAIGDRVAVVRGIGPARLSIE